MKRNKNKNYYPLKDMLVDIQTALLTLQILVIEHIAFFDNSENAIDAVNQVLEINDTLKEIYR